MTVELPANSLLQRSSRSGRLLMVPGIGPHQHGHLLFEAHINQICGWEITALDEQSFLQYAKNAKAKCLNIICYCFFFFLFYHSALRIDLDSLTVEKNKKSVWINIMSDFVVSQGALKLGCFCSVFQHSQADVSVAVGALCHMVICLVRCYLWRPGSRTQRVNA